MKMNSLKWVFPIFLFILACTEKNETHKVISKPVQSGIFGYGKEPEEKMTLKNHILISAGQGMDADEIVLNGCTFDAVIRDRDTIYLATNDTDFITPEKLKVGMKLGRVSAEIRKNITTENGWGYYISLKSGWNLGFCEGSACTDEKLTNDSKIKWIFKRK